MEAILITFSICVFGVMATIFLFSVAMRSRGEEEGPQASEGLPSPTGRFFLEGIPNPGAHGSIPTDTLMLQLERHFRLEEQAAVSFLEGPSVESLHAPSFSPLWD
jgi:hypothetical protein